MAIAKMKKMTLLAEQSSKNLLLKAVQELQGLEVIPVSEEDEEAMLDQLESQEDSEAKDQYDEKLQEVQFALDYLRNYVPDPGFFAKMRQRPESLTLDELEEQVNEASVQDWYEKIVQKEKQFEELSEDQKALRDQEAFLRKWSSLNYHPSEIEGLRTMYARTGTVTVELASELNEALNKTGAVYIEEIFQNKDEAAYLLVSSIENQATIEGILQEYQFTSLDYNYDKIPSEELKDNLSKQESFRKRKKELEKEIRSYGDAVRELELAEEYYYNLSQREAAQAMLLGTKNLILLSGWLEEEKIPQLTQLVEETVGKDGVVLIDDDVKMDEYKSVPIVLNNNGLVEPFETVTEMYSLPQYNEIDPTPLMMPFYIVFFGMMSGDLGYGLILWAATLAALKLFNLRGSMRKNIKFFHVISYGTMAFGLIFGSFFGAALPFALLSVQDDVIPILILSVVLGFIQMMTGLITNGVVKTKQGQKASAYIDGYAWAMILVGVVLWLAGSMLVDSQLLIYIGIGVAAVNAVGILFVSSLASKNKGLGLALGAYNLYGVSGYVGDLVSYTRLMALAVSSASIGLAFNMIVSFIPPLGRFTIGLVLMLVLHALNLFLTYLSAYVHTARLQFVEFFGKFYEGGGRPLNPLKTMEKHISLKNRNT